MNDNENGFTVWFTGLPSSGKTTIAAILEKQLSSMGYKVECLDGDVVRKTLSKGVGFTREERDLHLERIAHFCRILNKHGIIVIASFVSPYNGSRKTIREVIPKYAEIFVDCPLEECIKRDVKGFYKKALDGEIANFTGVSDPYEKPENPELTVRTNTETAQESADKVFKKLVELGHVTKSTRTENDKERQLFKRLRRISLSEVASRIKQHLCRNRK